MEEKEETEGFAEDRKESKTEGKYEVCVGAFVRGRKPKVPSESVNHSGQQNGKAIGRAWNCDAKGRRICE